MLSATAHRRAERRGTVAMPGVEALRTTKSGRLGLLDVAAEDVFEVARRDARRPQIRLFASIRLMMAGRHGEIGRSRERGLSAGRRGA